MTQGKHVLEEKCAMYEAERSTELIAQSLKVDFIYLNYQSHESWGTVLRGAGSLGRAPPDALSCRARSSINHVHAWPMELVDTWN